MLHLVCLCSCDRFSSYAPCVRQKAVLAAPVFAHVDDYSRAAAPGRHTDVIAVIELIAVVWIHDDTEDLRAGGRRDGVVDLVEIEDTLEVTEGIHLGLERKAGPAPGLRRRNHRESNDVPIILRRDDS